MPTAFAIAAQIAVGRFNHEGLASIHDTTDTNDGLPVSKKIENVRGLYLEGIRDGKPRQAINRYAGSRYTQHSTGVPDGPRGFVEFFEDFIVRNPKRDIRLVRMFEDGRYVFVHAFQSLNDGAAEWVTMDFFDTDSDDKMIEHWDVITSFTGETPSGHTSIDGPTDVIDLDRTGDNKTLVLRMIEDVLMEGGHPDQVGDYISAEQYIQHNSEVADGLENFKRLAISDKRPLVYDEVVLLVGQGNFVATLCRTRWHGEPFAQADLFRVDGGLIVEHWDAAEPIGPKETWLNSGKF